MDRKKFLLTTSLSVLGLNFVSSKTITTDFLLSENTNPLDIELLLKKAADLRKKRLASNAGTKAKAMSRRAFFSMPSSSTTTTNSVYQVYDQIIDSNPSEIRAYNGKRKALIQDGTSISTVVNMYEEASLNNPNSIVIQERLAKEYYRVLTGNKQALLNLSGTNSDKEQLLSVVENYLELAIQSDGKNKQYVTQLEKIKQLKEIDFFSSDNRTNVALKLRKKVFKLENSVKFNALTIDKLQANITALKSKSIESSRVKQIIKLEKQSIRILRKDKNYTEAVAKATAFYYANKNDSDGLKLVRNTLKKSKRYDLLEKIEIENDKSKNTFSSKMVLCDVLLKRKFVEKKSNDAECLKALDELKKLMRNGREKFEFMTRDIAFKLYTNASTLESSLLTLVKYAEGIDNSYVTYKVTQLSVDFLKKKSKNEDALLAVNMALGNIKQYDEVDPLLSQLFANSQHRTTTTIQQRRDLEILRDKLLT